MRNYDRQLGNRGSEQPDFYLEDEPEEIQICTYCCNEPATIYDEELEEWHCKRCNDYIHDKDVFDERNQNIVKGLLALSESINAVR